MCILFLLSPAFYLGADGKMKLAISRTGSRGLPAGSVTWPDGTSSQPELHLLLLEISFWIFLLPGWVPVRKCLFAKNKQELVAIERWPVCCLHLWHYDCNGHQNLAWECLFWVNLTGGSRGRNARLKLWVQHAETHQFRTGKHQLTDGQCPISVQSRASLCQIFFSFLLVFYPLTDINLWKSWHLLYPLWLWLLCVSA